LQKLQNDIVTIDNQREVRPAGRNASFSPDSFSYSVSGITLDTLVELSANESRRIGRVMKHVAKALATLKIIQIVFILHYFLVSTYSAPIYDSHRPDEDILAGEAFLSILMGAGPRASRRYVTTTTTTTTLPPPSTLPPMTLSTVSPIPKNEEMVISVRVSSSFGRTYGKEEITTEIPTTLPLDYQPKPISSNIGKNVFSVDTSEPIVTNHESLPSPLPLSSIFRNNRDNNNNRDTSNINTETVIYHPNREPNRARSVSYSTVIQNIGNVKPWVDSERNNWNGDEVKTTTTTTTVKPYFYTPTPKFFASTQRSWGSGNYNRFNNGNNYNQMSYDNVNDKNDNGYVNSGSYDKINGRGYDNGKDYDTSSNDRQYDTSFNVNTRYYNNNNQDNLQNGNQGLMRNYEKPEKSYENSPRNYEKPEKVYDNQNYEKSEKNYESPIRQYNSYDRRYETQSPEQNYEVDEAVSVQTNGRIHGVQPKINPILLKKDKDKDDSQKVGYVVEGRNYRKYRVEERTSDGFIVGEYGVVSHDDGSLRGVRYTADGTINPRLIYDALMKFLSL